uniref:Translation initiation factor IF-2 like n=1 Tax=Tanacetum cinerariifolium TaxID=118510 RepID=A0A6L2J199_TANCI|nr:translation initiation factor IF-2 like [Tanacetum cinerariifolium]
MADNPNSSHAPPNPFSSIISKFTDVFNNFRFPPPPVKVDTVAGDDVAEEKPVSIRYPDASGVDVAQVKVESGEVQHVTNPAVMWQVYAIGGFFLLKWAVARWKEQRAKKKPSDEDSPPPTAAETNE